MYYLIYRRYPNSAPIFFIGRDAQTNLTWTFDYEAATRFAQKADAESYVQTETIVNSGVCTSVEAVGTLSETYSSNPDNTTLEQVLSAGNDAGGQSITGLNEVTTNAVNSSEVLELVGGTNTFLRAATRVTVDAPTELLIQQNSGSIWIDDDTMDIYHPLEVNVSAISVNMNSTTRILNLPAPSYSTEPVRLTDQTSALALKQPLSTLLSAIAALSTSADKSIIFTAANTPSMIDYKFVSEQALGGTVTWTGTTFPSGTTNHRLVYLYDANMVWYYIILDYGTAGAALTNFTITNIFGTGAGQLPVPNGFNNWTAALDCSSRGGGLVSTGKGMSTGATLGSLIRRNSGNTAWEIANPTFASGAYRYAHLSGTYIKA